MSLVPAYSDLDDDDIARISDLLFFLEGNRVDGPGLPDFVDHAWLLRNTFLTSVDLKAFIQSLPDLDEELGNAFAGCVSRDDFLARLLPLMNRWDLMVQVFTMFPMRKGSLSRSFFGPLLAKAHAMAWPGLAPPPLPAASSEVYRGLARLIDDPANRQLGCEATYACFAMNPGMASAIPQLMDLPRKLKEAPEWLPSYVEFNHKTAESAPRRTPRGTGRATAPSLLPGIPIPVHEYPEETPLQQAFDIDWFERNLETDATGDSLEEMAVASWNDLGDTEELATLLAQLREMGEAGSPIEKAVVAMREAGKRHRVQPSDMDRDVRLADAMLTKGSRRDVEIARGGVLGLLQRPSMPAGLDVLFRKHASKLDDLRDLYDDRVDIDGEPTIPIAEAPKRTPKPPRTPANPAESRTITESSSPAMSETQKEIPVKHVAPIAAVPGISAWEAASAELVDAALGVSGATGVDAMRASVAAIREILVRMDAIAEASDVGPDGWEGIEAILSDLASVQIHSRAKNDTRDCAGLAALVEEQRSKVRAPDMALLAELTNTALILSKQTVDMFAQLHQGGMDTDLLQRAGATAKDACAAYELAYDEIAGAVKAEAPSVAVATKAVEPVVAEIATAPAQAPSVTPQPVREAPIAVVETVAAPEPAPDQAAQAPSVASNGRWDDAMRRLVAERALGLAYHLAIAAEEAGQPTPYAASELRLAAVAGRLSLSTINVTGMPVEIRDALGATLAVAEQDEFGTGPEGNARRMLAFAGAIEPALVGRDHSAMALVERITLDPAWNKASFPLKEAVRAASKGGQPLTVELFKGLRDADEARNDLETARKGIKDACAFLSRQSFVNFPTGTRTAHALGERTGEVGSLAIQIDGNPTQAYNAAKRFAQAYSTESGADDLIHIGKDSFASTKEKRVPITGKVRSSMIGAIHAIAENCASYVAARDAATEIEGQKRGHYDEIRERLLAAVDACAKATEETLSTCDDAQELGAGAVLTDALKRLRLILDGIVRNPGQIDHLLALHAPIAAIPGLRHGRGWLPLPAEAATVADAIASAPVFRELDESVRSAFEMRVTEGATSSATILVELAQSLGLECAPALTKELPEAIARMRPSVSSQIDAARRTLENIERAGDPSEQDEAARLTEELDLIDLPRLPFHVDAENRAEEPDAKSTIVDFAGVVGIVERIMARGHAINARRREEMHRDLDQVELDGKISAQTVEQVRRIVDADDLVYASEWIANLQAGVEVPEDRKADASFGRFFPAVPAYLSTLKGDVARTVAADAEIGRDAGPLGFGKVGPGRRAAARDFLLSFDALGRFVRERSPAPGVVRNLVECLNKLGIASVGQPERIEDVGTGSTRSVSFQIGLDVPQDENSSVLPDFGSQTLGRWNLMVSPTLPSDQDMAKFLANGSMGGFMVFVTSLVGVEDRRKLAQTCRVQRRKLLVVDAAIVAAAATEPALRAASIIELAQPFAHATPFRDHGRGQVPPEMYMGRKQEMAQIVDPYGPCVVYGARRNGKTATLLHVAATQNSPKTGFVAAHTSVQGIGKTEGGRVDDIWVKISAAMPDVFRTPVHGREAFGTGVRRYLDAKGSRRILLMLDECDDVIERDAENGFQAFLTLQDLMEATQRRFKVVFAGLRNVSRLVRDGNAPLKHIASNPIRIGPFVGVELAEAERLVTKPFAAMGYEFSSRDLVWRMLARANFAPGLVQVMCERMLEFLRARPFDPRNNPPVLIDEAVVRDALADPVVMDAVVKTFFISIDYDRRYVLLANAIANADIVRADSGIFSEGMTLAEIHKDASFYWSGMFGGVDGLALVEDTVDEMEGLGLVKRVGDDRWALRSPSIRRLLGNKEAVESRLEGFLIAPPSTEFDFRTNRKSIARTGSDEPDHLSPLTGAQMGKVYRGRASVMVASGSGASDIHFVTDALADEAGGYRGQISRITALTKPRDVGTAIHAACAQEGERLILVGLDRPWTTEWVREAASAAFGNKRMIGERPEVRIVFVADPRRTIELVEERNQLSIDWVAPRPWSDGMLDRAGEKYGVTLIGEERETFAKVTGNLNGLASEALRFIAGDPDKDAALKRWFAAQVAKGDLPDRLGILPPLAEWFALAGEMVGMGDNLTVSDVGGFLDGCKRPKRFVNYAMRMGLASTAKDANDQTFVVFNPILKTLADATGK